MHQLTGRRSPEELKLSNTPSDPLGLGCTDLLPTVSIECTGSKEFRSRATLFMVEQWEYLARRISLWIGKLSKPNKMHQVSLRWRTSPPRAPSQQSSPGMLWNNGQKEAII